jgi:hypothetical protein
LFDEHLKQNRLQGRFLSKFGYPHDISTIIIFFLMYNYCMKEKLSKIRKHPKTPAILTALMFGGVSFAAVHHIPKPPLLANTSQFVLFAEQSLSFEDRATVSSGDVGTNGNLEAGKDSTVNGNIFADKISLDKNTTVNGNATYNKLTNKGEILGTKTTPASLPIANLPTVQPFSIGTEDKTFSGNTNTLPSGNYQNIILQKDSTLTLSGGIYNLNILDLKEHSTLIFTAETTLNIQFKFRVYDNVSILNGQNAKPEDLHINYVGIRNEQRNDRTKEQGNNGSMEQDDESEVMAFLDKNEKADCQNQKIGRPIVFGKNSFLNFALIAPRANVFIGKDSTMRGQILARKARVGRNFIASRRENISKDSNKDKVVGNPGERFVVNEVVLRISETATMGDIKPIAEMVNGKIIGYMELLRMVKIEIPSSNVSELNRSVAKLKALNSPFIQDVMINFVFN